MELLISIFVSIATTWGVAYFYFKKTNTQRPSWFSVNEIKALLAKNPQDLDWTAKQIVQLYNNKVFNFKSGDPLPYNFCPRCGSKNLQGGSYTNTERDDTYHSLECQDCEWGDWTG